MNLANTDENIFSKLISEPFNIKQKNFKEKFPAIIDAAKESEISFFKICRNSEVILRFLQDFEIVNKKNLEFTKDVLEGKDSKVRRFLRLNKTKKDNTTMRIAVSLSIVFKHAEVLDLLVKNLSRDFLA